MMATDRVIGVLLLFASVLAIGNCIQCYQCDSNEDISCPGDRRFDTTINAMVDCNSFEAHVPGQFCMKIYQESPGYGGWKKITRRCGSRTDFGVAWGCRWSWDYTGVFRETCYCEDKDGCNSSSRVHISLVLAVICFLAVKLNVLFI
ncbi:UPAR/Ly6 domain-containing protein crok-like [Haliotis asinina]|uniref:UPAR/Ly6 domain-containing protein crok-like n=1 Tax=Haliotis asinina TaxID=109174 RepID=UPI003532144F